MKRTILAILVAGTLALGSGVAAAAERDPVYEDYDDSITHPLRIAYYLAHPFGYAAEWLVGRPFHYIISRPHLDRIFGYQPYSEETMMRPAAGAF